MPDNEDNSHQEEGARSVAAITYPEGSAARAGPNQVRNPRNLQGLLRFATELTRNEDAAGPSVMLPMDEERRKFLEEAINSLTIDTTSEMQLGISVLSNKEIISAINCDALVPCQVVQAFDTLIDIVINLDMSVGFVKLGGYKIFPVCLCSENGEVKSQACQLLAETCQNNPFCQSKALESGFVHILVNILKSEDCDRVLRSALYATSCLVREHESCAKTFLAEGGCDALVRCLQLPSDILRNKAAFLLCNIYPKRPEMKAKATVLLDGLTASLMSIVDDNPGNLLNAVRTVIYSSDQVEENVLSQCSDKVVMDLKQSVEKHMRFCLADVSMYMEEIDYCKDILKIIHKLVKNRSNTSELGSVDR